MAMLAFGDLAPRLFKIELCTGLLLGWIHLTTSPLQFEDQDRIDYERTKVLTGSTYDVGRSGDPFVCECGHLCKSKTKMWVLF